MNWHHYFEIASIILEVLGVLVIFGGIFMGIYRASVSVYHKTSDETHIYTHIREEIARAILLGLEILIAVDIIKTVSSDLTMENITTLGLIVLIRTVLSISLEWEIENRLPWKKTETPEEK